jgi:hypothetical protein
LKTVDGVLSFSALLEIRLCCFALPNGLELSCVATFYCGQARWFYIADLLPNRMLCLDFTTLETFLKPQLQRQLE